MIYKPNATTVCDEKNDATVFFTAVGVVNFLWFRSHTYIDLLCVFISRFRVPELDLRNIAYEIRSDRLWCRIMPSLPAATVRYTRFTV